MNNPNQLNDDIFTAFTNQIDGIEFLISAQEYRQILGTHNAQLNELAAAATRITH